MKLVGFKFFFLFRLSNYCTFKGADIRIQAIKKYPVNILHKSIYISLKTLIFEGSENG